MRVCVHPSVAWFRRDLRTVDHRLLAEAAERGL
jgi:deoxyribodipyrimidine photolyase